MLHLYCNTEARTVLSRQNVCALKFHTVEKLYFLVCSQASTETGLTLFWINLPGTTSKKFMSWACQSSPPPLSSIFSSPSYCTLTFLQAKSTQLSHFSATPPLSKPPIPTVNKHRTLHELIYCAQNSAEHVMKKTWEIRTPPHPAASSQETSAFVLLLVAAVSIFKEW